MSINNIGSNSSLHKTKRDGLKAKLARHRFYVFIAILSIGSFIINNHLEKNLTQKTNTVLHEINILDDLIVANERILKEVEIESQTFYKELETYAEIPFDNIESDRFEISSNLYKQLNASLEASPNKDMKALVLKAMSDNSISYAEYLYINDLYDIEHINSKHDKSLSQE